MSSTTPQLHFPVVVNVHTPVLPTSLSVAAVIVCTIFGVLATSAVSFRFYAQRHSKHGILIEDYVFIAALVFVVASCILGVYAACDAGLGWPSLMLLGPAGFRFTKSLLAGQVLWATAIALTRTALLLFYRRIFAIRTFRIANNIVLAFNAAWFVTYFIGTVSTWDVHLTEQYAINFPVWLITNCVLDVVQDLVTLCLPLAVIRKLNMKRKRKFLVSGVFFLGIFCVIASAVRLKYFIQLSKINGADRQFSATTFHSYIWSVVQECVTITTACLPAYGPAFSEGRRLRTLFTSMQSLLASKKSQPSYGSKEKVVGIPPASRAVKWGRMHSSSSDDTETKQIVIYREVDVASNMV